MTSLDQTTTGNVLLSLIIWTPMIGALLLLLVPRDNPADVREDFLQNVRDQLKLGITSVIQAGASVDPNVVGSWAEWERLYGVHGEELPRASVQIGYPAPAGQAQAGAARLKEFGKRTGDGGDRLRVGSIGEMAADGGFTGPTAWVLVDYKGQPGKVLLIQSGNRLSVTVTSGSGSAKLSFSR